MDISWAVHEALEIPFEPDNETQMCLIKLTAQGAAEEYGENLNQFSVAPTEWYRIPYPMALGLHDPHNGFLLMGTTGFGWRCVKERHIESHTLLGFGYGHIDVAIERAKRLRTVLSGHQVEYVDYELFEAVRTGVDALR
ncbi:MAG: hypothetical protein JSS66_07285 [Armatimonadetes bacterium]|nr:hypothetical protein [Armatimonadota bacterium]